MYQEKDMTAFNYMLDGAALKGKNIKLPQNAAVAIERKKTCTAGVFSLFEGKDLVLQKSPAAGAYYMNMMRYYKLDREHWPNNCGVGFAVKGAIITAPPDEYQEKWIEMWEYDLNSAYLAVLAYWKMPDVNWPFPGGVVQEDECGWSINTDGQLEYVATGEWAQERYKLIESPWKVWAQGYYDQIVKLKKKGKLAELKKKKEGYVVAIGVLKNQCPPLAGWILHCARQELISYADENTVAFNTDCLYSLKQRPDLTARKGLGAFKEDGPRGHFWRGCNYQVDGGRAEDNVLRGIGGLWQEHYDIVSDSYVREPDYGYYGGKIYDRRTGKTDTVDAK